MRRAALLCLLLIGPLLAGAQKNSTVERVSKQEAFQSGEKLFYHIRYGFAKGAEARFETSDTLIQGKRAFRHNIAGWTTGLLDMLYPVYDVYTTYTDPLSDLPLRAVRNVREQKYLDYKVDLYDRHSRKDSVEVTRETGARLVFPRNTMDLVSAVYFVRNRLSNMKLKKGVRIEIPVYFNAEFYPLVIQYVGDEIVKTKFGKMKCHRFLPLVKTGDLFKTQDAITVWLTADENHIPVRVRFKLFLGSMYCDLVNFQGLKWPLQMVMKK